MLFFSHLHLLTHRHNLVRRYKSGSNRCVLLVCTGTHRYDTISPEALLLIAEPATTPIVGVYTPPALNPNERI